MYYDLDGKEEGTSCNHWEEACLAHTPLLRYFMMQLLSTTVLATIHTLAVGLKSEC